MNYSRMDKLLYQTNNIYNYNYIPQITNYNYIPHTNNYINHSFESTSNSKNRAIDYGPNTHIKYIKKDSNNEFCNNNLCMEKGIARQKCLKYHNLIDLCENKYCKVGYYNNGCKMRHLSYRSDEIPVMIYYKKNG